MINHKHKGNFIKQRENQTIQSRDVIPDVDVPQIKEPMPVCSICGEQINAIIEAIREADGSFSHFDCVLNKLSKQYHVEEPDKLSYVGHGCFAVVGKNEEGSIVFKEKIQYENNDTFNSMKHYVEESKE